MLRNLSKYFPRRCLSSTPAGVTLPPNLTLPDLSVLEPPKPCLITPLEGKFPTKFTETTIPIIKFENPEEKNVGTAYLDPRVFGVAIRQDIIHQIVRYQRAKIRQPQRTKRIGDIRGSTRKLYQQKGTGRARVGQSRSAIRRGGMKSHGPVLRDFSFDLNRKTKALGMMVALAAKFREGNLHIVDKIHVSEPRTKALTSILEKHGLLSSMGLYMDVESNANFEMASRNLHSAAFIPEHEANVYDIVRREKLVISAAALKALQDRIIAQREYNGKRKSVVNNFAEYERLSKIGQSGI